MMQGIKNIIGRLMTKRHRKKSVLILLWILFCLFAPPKLAYSGCYGYTYGGFFFPTIGCYTFGYDCTSEAEALDLVGVASGLGMSIVNNGDQDAGFSCHGGCYIAELNACTGGSICWFECDINGGLHPPPRSEYLRRCSRNRERQQR